MRKSPHDLPAQGLTCHDWVIGGDSIHAEAGKAPDVLWLVDSLYEELQPGVTHLADKVGIPIPLQAEIEAIEAVFLGVEDQL